MGSSSKSRKILKRFNFPYTSIKKTVIVAIFIFIFIFIFLFFYFQYQTEQSIRDHILEQQQQNQKDLTRSLAQHIQSDFNLIMARLEGLAYSQYIQIGNFGSNDTKPFMQNYYHQITSTSPVDRLFILDANGVDKVDIIPQGQHSFVGMNFSYRDWVKETKNSLIPQFSNSFVGRDGKYRIALTYPITIKGGPGTINYAGLVGAVIPTIVLFGYYGNTYNIQLKYLSV